MKLCDNDYKSVGYHTFSKNGVLKLTEVELYFLSSKMTKDTSHEWAVVYLGVGNGERFRYLRDDFFPGLSVIAFDPLDSFFETSRDEIERNAELWSNDGSNFTFLIRCFEEDEDIGWMKEKLRGKRLLFISDIRGMNLVNHGTRFDKAHDQEVQWRAIQCLRPESSLVKFNVPDGDAEYYDYVPGVLLKQIFCYYGTTELRLLIDGVPEETRRYNLWELFEKVAIHHDRLRGQVYATTRRADRLKCTCLDSCFDCTVLWNTVSSYAEKNSVDPYDCLRNVMQSSLWGTRESRAIWPDVWFYLKQGRLMEAMAALDTDGQDDDVRLDVDARGLLESLSSQQPDLARRLTISLPRQASRADLIKVLGSLSKPFTLMKSELNALLEYPSWSWSRPVDANRRKVAAEIQNVDMPEKKSDVCWYYENGWTCSRGDDCTYKHGDLDVRSKRYMCWFFQQGHCSYGARCWLSHDVVEANKSA